MGYFIGSTDVLIGKKLAYWICLYLIRYKSLFPYNSCNTNFIVLKLALQFSLFKIRKLGEEQHDGLVVTTLIPDSEG